MSGSDREALLDVRELSVFPPGCQGVVGRHSRMSGSCREALPHILQWSGGSPGYPEVPLGCPGVVGRLFRMSGSGWETLLDVREWS